MSYVKRKFLNLDYNSPDALTADVIPYNESESIRYRLDNHLHDDRYVKLEDYQAQSTLVHSVIEPPTLSGDDVAYINYEYELTIEYVLSLDNVSMEKIVINWGDGNPDEEITNPSSPTTVTHIYTSGNDGEQRTITVKLVDELDNESESSTKIVTLNTNQPPDASNVTLSGLNYNSSIGRYEINENTTKQISFSGGTDPEGQPVTYKITDTGLFTFSKTSNIQENEQINITSPSVSSDTNSSFTVKVVDDQGLESNNSKVFPVRIYNVDYGALDIFGDGSCLSYIPFKNGQTSDLGGILSGSLANGATCDSDGLRIDAEGEYFRFNSNSFSDWKSITVQVRLNTSNYAEYNEIMSLYFGSATERLRIDTANGPHLYLRGGGSCNGTAPVSVNTWFLAYIEDGGYYDSYFHMHLHKDAQTTITCNKRSSSRVVQMIAMGAYQNSTYFSDISIKNLRIFNRTLTVDERQTLMNES